MGVIVGVAVIITMVSFGLGLQRNMLSRFRALDLFNEMRVFGKNVFSLAATGGSGNSNRSVENPNSRRGPSFRPDKEPTRILDDAAIDEIRKIPGVAYVEPSVTLFTYVRCNGHAEVESIAGASVPNSSARFTEFKAGQMISSPQVDEAIIKEAFARDFGFENPADAIGKTIEFLAAPKPGAKDDQTEKPEEDEQTGFFGLPLDQNGSGGGRGGLVAKTFRIVGVLDAQVKEGAGQGGLRGLIPDARIYIPLPAAKQWSVEHRGPMSMVAMALAREGGSLGESDGEGYDSAVVRVTDPVALTEVRRQLTEKGFGSFSIVDQLDQIRTVFLIIDSVLGLLGGISLLVASFGIANTMIMSILERTREIGIMKAIGAEDREIKLIFFFEAAVIGLTGGILGALAAWGIDAVANRLVYRFFLKPQGASFVDFFYLPPYLWLGAIAFALVVSILAALYPAARAARIDPVRALRHD
jgi:hypothetical protein